METMSRGKSLNSTLKSEKGLALILVVMITALLFPLLFSGVRSSGLNLQVASNLKVGDITLQVADMGIQHALAVIPSGGNFTYSLTTTVVPSTNHPTLTDYSYSVTAINTAGGAQAILTSTAVGPPNGTTKKVATAYVTRSQYYGLGAIGLPGSTAPNTDIDFSGTGFSISGNDNCNTAPAVPGIAVSDPALQTKITNALTSGQAPLVTGSGGSPSVRLAPDTAQSVDQMANSYIALPHTTLGAGTYSSGQWGTLATPQVTWITGNATLSGTVDGYGVLVVDGSLSVAGNFTFHGLVIARRNMDVQFSGNAGVYGSVLIGDKSVPDPEIELQVMGNAQIRYDSCSLAWANSQVPLPKLAKLIAWYEKLS